VMGLFLASLRPQMILLPILRDARAMLLPVPSLAGDTYGTFRTRYWMWGDAIRQLVGKNSSSLAFGSEIANPLLRERIFNDPMETVKPHVPVAKAVAQGPSLPIGMNFENPKISMPT